MRILIVLLCGITLCACASMSTPTTKTTILKCSNSQFLQVTYPDENTAILEWDNGTFTLNSAISASGARYTGEGWQWWTKGDSGHLTPMKADEKFATQASILCVPFRK